jgi:signal transduction histidine kinase
MALERVFANLMHNALKFTPERGRVKVSSSRQKDEVVVAVADTGLGIAPEEMPLIFEKYQRAAATQRREGTGLGLSVVKALVGAHGGRVEVESTLGRGTCFSVFLPIVSADPARL